MRITQGMLSSTTLRNLNRNMERLERLQDELTSGQRISVPSDDPIGVASALEFRSTIDELDQNVKNADGALAWLGASDSALDSIGGALQRARELAALGANDSMSSTDRQAAAVEVESLLDLVVALGNSTFGGQYLFSGFKIGAAPFAPVGSPPTAIGYNGDNGQISRQLDSRSSVIVNVSGASTLNPVFTALINLRDALIGGSAPTISSRLTEISDATNSLLAARSQVGARMNRVVDQKERMESLKVQISGLLSNIEDVDMTETITMFATQQNVYQAALGAAAKAIQPNLLDYLR